MPVKKGNREKAIDIIKKWEAEEVPIYIVIFEKENKMELLVEKITIPDACFYGNHPRVYSLKEIGDIAEALSIEEIVIDSLTVSKNDIRKEFSKKKPYEKLKFYKESHAKKIIFLTKKTNLLFYFLCLKKIHYICLASPRGLSADIYNECKKIKEKDYKLIMLFTDADELARFANTKTNGELENFYPVILTIKEINKLASSDGFYINPSSSPVVQKDFSFFLINDMLKYAENMHKST